MSLSLFTEFQPLAAIATTPSAAETLYPLCQTIGATLHLPDSLTPFNNSQTYTISLKEHLATLWKTQRTLIFCLATGAVVRLIAPLLEDKSTDPAIIVIDQTGKWVISLCSGHTGGADRLAELIATELDATPIITGASANLGLPAIDILGLPFGWRKGEGDWTQVSAAIARQEKVQVIQEVGSTLWQDHLPENHPFYFGFPEADQAIIPAARIWISATKRQFAEKSDFPRVQWHPRVLWVGIGCIRGTSRQLIETAIEQVFQRYHLATAAIAGLATIDLKADETGLLEYCIEKQLPLKTFAAEVLGGIEVPNPSEIVSQEVGTKSVAEASALSAVSPQKAALIVPKQIIKSEQEMGAVTIAIAQSDLEYTGKIGQLWLVGIGPGKLDQMTPAAMTAIKQADVIIGYSLYLELIKPLQRKGQIVESFPITQEQKRAQRAIELAQWGLTVAVISSGDCGIYGMAGLVLEELQQAGWDGHNPKLEVFAGISAIQAAASRVGAPLMHDFCTISLSDLLTPWQVIEKRLEAAAKADFVTGIYNPRSQTRTGQIIKAQEIFLKFRNPNTPVAIVHSAYREQEQITLTTLEKMLDFPIDMLTTVIIGNCSTRQYANWLITPRGYIS
ncbi:precorrin-3B C(17)-methyltransferase [Gloeothece verrucosa]|uniref:Precorrin-3B C17-methyltransferase n=1 Tax=Gloeothece verrucosa (strain PCC 7822) TaxID=497965 RepID=E0UB60_GLOV7|nr:precorrin-3B C(17)-methyltransferase [Gloeothece verrucosa]ADN16305.1 precorrin-3B C17-methyltransferase [Gloeothece verrucosa PCC 7822]